MDAGPAREEIDSDPWWDEFDSKYRLTPSVKPERLPAIDEPGGSVTIDLSPIFARPGARFAAGEAALNALALWAFIDVIPASQRMIVLDHQHPTHAFWPHRCTSAPDDWPVTPFPNGDYYAFFSEDLETGTFGHPWEQTLCVIGDLVEVLTPALAAWLPIRRDHR